VFLHPSRHDSLLAVADAVNGTADSLLDDDDDECNGDYNNCAEGDNGNSHGLKTKIHRLIMAVEHAHLFHPDLLSDGVYLLAHKASTAVATSASISSKPTASAAAHTGQQKNIVNALKHIAYWKRLSAALDCAAFRLSSFVDAADGSGSASASAVGRLLFDSDGNSNAALDAATERRQMQSPLASMRESRRVACFRDFLPNYSTATAVAPIMRTISLLFRAVKVAPRRELRKLFLSLRDEIEALNHLPGLPVSGVYAGTLNNTGITNNSS